MNYFRKLNKHFKYPDYVDVFLEIPKGSVNKYEFSDGFLKFNRKLDFSGYPCSYGFIPNTMGQDGDALDALILSEEPILPQVIVRSKVLGALNMEDEEGIDHKIVTSANSKFLNYNNLDDVPLAEKDKIWDFFEHYKDFSEGKFTKIYGWLNQKEALDLILSSKL